MNIWQKILPTYSNKFLNVNMIFKIMIFYNVTLLSLNCLIYDYLYEPLASLSYK